jgi:hypothetical protein
VRPRSRAHSLTSLNTGRGVTKNTETRSKRASPWLRAFVARDTCSQRRLAKRVRDDGCKRNVRTWSERSAFPFSLYPFPCAVWLDAFMRIVILLSWICTLIAPLAAAQTPPAQPPGTAAPAQPRQPRTGGTARTALVVTATDETGATLAGIRVELVGATDRTGETDENGQVRFANMRAGTYRIRLSGDNVITLEREVIVRANQTADVDVTLHAISEAEEEPEPEEPATPPPSKAPTPAPAGPPGDPKLVSILDLLEKDFIGRQQRKETPLGCSGNARATMIQLNEQQPERLYDTAESMYYVLGGEGTIRLNGRESALGTGSFAVVPRGISHAFMRKGRRPLILLALLSGEPCQAP